MSNKDQDPKPFAFGETVQLNPETKEQLRQQKSVDASIDDLTTDPDRVFTVQAFAKSTDGGAVDLVQVSDQTVGQLRNIPRKLLESTPYEVPGIYHASERWSGHPPSRLEDLARSRPQAKNAVFNREHFIVPGNTKPDDE